MAVSAPLVRNLVVASGRLISGGFCLPGCRKSVHTRRIQDLLLASVPPVCDTLSRYGFSSIASTPASLLSAMEGVQAENATVSATVENTKIVNAVENATVKPEKVNSAESANVVAEDHSTNGSNSVETDSGSNGTLAATSEASAGPKRERIRKRKTVFLMSYCGQEYYGMQMNPDTKTIEDEFFKSLLKNNYIEEEAYKKPQVAQYQRAARTDKHVSAARQIVSLKIDENVQIEKINEFLPPEIRIMGMKRVTKNFDAKNSCDARTYMYMTPTFAFAPLEVNVTEDYRITPDIIPKVRDALSIYIGTKNFHNFTSRKRPNDPSAMRQIKSFTCSEPFVKDGIEYVILRVKGQSFMMHQIRKMIGLVMAYIRGFAPRETFDKCWSAERIDIPRAPGVGLMLDYVHYERYDQRFGSDGIHDPLTWDSIEDKIQQFCDEHIFPIITRSENEDKSMLTWLSTMPFHTYDVREPAAPGGEPSSQSKIGKAFYKVLKERGEDFKIGNDDDEIGGDDSEDEREVVRAKKARIGAV